MDLLTLTALLGEEEWDTAEDNLPDLLPALSETTKKCLSGSFEFPETEQFQRFLIPFLNRLLNSQKAASDPELFTSAFSFLEVLIESACKLLHTLPSGHQVDFLLDAMEKIFSSYAFFTCQPTTDASTNPTILGLEYIRDNFDHHFHIPFLKLANHFGVCSGINAIKTLLNTPAQIQCYLRVLHFFQPIKPVISYKILPEIQNIIFESVLAFDEELLKATTKRDLDGLIDEVCQFLAEFETSKVITICEKFKLNFAFKCFNSTLLEKRLQGLLHIQDIILARKGYTRQNSCRELAKWVSANGIIEYVFDRTKTRDQVVKAASLLPPLLAEYDQLRTSQLLLIFDCTKDKYLAPIVFKILDQVNPTLGSQQVTALAGQIQKTPPPEWTVELVNFYWSTLCSRYAQKKDKATLTAMFNQLWDLAKDGSDTTDEVLECALSHLDELHTDIRQEMVLEMLLDKIENEMDVIQTLILLSMFFDHLDEIDEDFKDYKVKVLNAIVKETLHYKTKAMDMYNCLEEKPSDPMQMVYLGRYRHFFALQKRFEMLTHLVKEAGGAFTRRQLYLLFHRFVPCQMRPSESESHDAQYDSHSEETAMCLEWLIQLVSPTLEWKGYVISSHLQSSIFHSLICEVVGWEKMSQAAFACFRAYFWALNVNSIRIKSLHENVFRVEQWPTSETLNELWHGAVQIRDKSVAKQAIDFLLNCYISISPRLMPQFHKAAITFIERCFAGIGQTLRAEEDSTESQSSLTGWEQVFRVDRYLTILNTFFQKTEYPPVEIEPHPASVPRPTTKEEMEKQDQVLAVLGDQINNPVVATLALHRSGWDVNNACNILLDPDERELLITEAQPYEAFQQLPNIPTPPAYQPPSSWFVSLHGGTLFDDLVKLFDEEILDVDLNLVWAMTHKLPPNHSLQRCLTELCSTPQKKTAEQWKNLFDPDRAFKLLHSLTMFDNVIHQGCSSEFLQNFVLAGGARFLSEQLHQMILSIQTILSDTVTKSCLTRLLRILGFFFQATVDHRISARTDELISQTSVFLRSDLGPIDPFGTPEPLPASTIAHFKSELKFDTLFLAVLKLLQALPETPEATSTRGYSNGWDDISSLVYCTSLTISLLISGIDDALFFLDIPQDFLAYFLLECPNNICRFLCAKGFHAFCLEFPATESSNPVMFFLSFLSNRYPFETPKYSSEAFQFASSLVELCYSKKYEIPSLSLLFERLLHEFDICSGDLSDYEPDMQLQGTLQLLFTFFNSEQHLIGTSGAQFLPKLVDSLIPIAGNPDPLKCLTGPTRTMAFEILLSLAAVHTNFSVMITLLASRILDQTPQEREPLRTIEFRDRRQKYVGLQNLNNLTCYASSILQQFFMNPDIRLGLLNAQPIPEDDDNAPKDEKPSTDTELPLNRETKNEVDTPNDDGNAPKNGDGNVPKNDDNTPAKEAQTPQTPDTPTSSQQKSQLPPIISELQKMFLYLQESKRKKYNPSTFLAGCLSPDMHAGQQDVNEFFQLLADRLEIDLKHTNQTKLIQSTFNATLTRHIHCPHNPLHKTIGEEHMNALSVEMENQSCLEDALTCFFQGEKIQDYMCASCSQLVEVTRSYSLKSLPKTLIIHLKRFTYSRLKSLPYVLRYTSHLISWNLTHMQKQKIYNKFEYPSTLYMGQFVNPSEAHNTQQDCPYRLTGVIVHSGSADEGHYYSIILDRTSPSPSRGWYKFDDHVVTPFDYEDLEDETFGGHLEYHEWVTIVTTQSEQMKDKVVYMLFYEQAESYNFWKDEENRQKLFSSGPKDLRAQIYRENQNLLAEQLEFDGLYFKFLFRLLGDLKFERVLTPSQSPPAIFQAIQLAITFFMEKMSVEADSKKENQYKGLSRVLKQYLQAHVPACKWLLHTLTTRNTQWLHFHLLSCPHPYIRKGFSAVLKSAIQTLELNLPWEQAHCPANADLDTLQQSNTIAQFIDFIYNILDFNPHHWHRFRQLFGVIKTLLTAGPPIRCYMIKNKFLGKLLRFYAKLDYKSPPTDTAKLVSCIACAIRGSHTITTRTSGPPPTCFPDKELVVLSDSELNYLGSSDFTNALHVLVYHCVDPVANVQIFSHLSWKNLIMSQSLIQILQLHMNCHVEFFQYLKTVLVELLRLDDGLVQHRVTECFTGEHGLIQQMVKFASFPGCHENGLLIAETIADLIQTNRHVAYLFQGKNFSEIYAKFTEEYQLNLQRAYAPDTESKLARLGFVSEKLHVALSALSAPVTQQ